MIGMFYIDIEYARRNAPLSELYFVQSDNDRNTKIIKNILVKIWRVKRSQK